MTETKQHYAQIEKEVLALTWACQRLSQYLLGSKFILETDHKPLIPLLLTKNLDLPIRVRFRLRMMRYQYEIILVPGKELNTADYLSYSPLQETGSTNELQEEVQAHVNHIVKYLPASDKRLIQIWEHQIKDPILCSWKDQVLGGGKRRNNKIKNYALKDRLLITEIVSLSLKIHKKRSSSYTQDIKGLSRLKKEKGFQFGGLE